MPSLYYRLYPPAQSVVRAVGEEPLELDGYTLPKKSHIFINVYDIHRLEEYWGKDSDTFEPDRFAPENMAKFHPYQFVPFGGGNFTFFNPYALQDRCITYILYIMCRSAQLFG